MGSKDKAKKRNDKKFEALAAQFKAASSPTNPPARSPAVGPVRLTRILVPLETLPTGVWQQIAAFATTTTAATPSAVLKTVALVSRSCALAVEGGRHRQGQTPTQVVHAVLQKHAARGQPLPPTLQPLLAADSGAADLSATLAAVAACKDVAVIGRVAFAIVKLGRSVLHHVRRPDPPAAATEWLVSLVASGAMPLATHNVTTGRTLLHYAALFGDRSLASALITAAAKSPAGFDVFAVDSQRRTALHVAAGEGLADTCLCMIRYSDPARLDSLGTAQDASKRTVVDAATAASHSKLASTLREALHSVDDEDDGDYNDDEGYDDDY